MNVVCLTQHKDVQKNCGMRSKLKEWMCMCTKMILNGTVGRPEAYRTHATVRACMRPSGLSCKAVVCLQLKLEQLLQAELAFEHPHRRLPAANRAPSSGNALGCLQHPCRSHCCSHSQELPTHLLFLNGPFCFLVPVAESHRHPLLSTLPSLCLLSHFSIYLDFCLCYSDESFQKG